MQAPIALFAYKRPEHLRRCIAALAANPEASRSDLYIFSDASREASAAAGVDEVRAVIGSISGFARVVPVFREVNFGLARSIIDGVGRVCAEHGRVVVVEDDLVVSQHFLAYMNDGLTLYASDLRVASIHGYVYPAQIPLPETFFLRGTDCWGWATWSRAWQVFEPDAGKLLTQLRERGLAHSFDMDGVGPFISMLEDFIAGRNDSWAVRWHAATYLRGMLTLYPGLSLVNNIGIDGSGTHSGVLDMYAGVLADMPVKVERIELAENLVARGAFREFFASTRPSPPSRFLRRIRETARRVIRS